jgi:hypothetical protein
MDDNQLVATISPPTLPTGTRTAHDIAGTIGQGVFATTTVVHQLARLGIMTTDPKTPESPMKTSVPVRHVLSFVRATIVPTGPP